MADDDRPLQGRTEGTEPVHIRTFLIADVRGYTLFTQERGDEAATKLAARFADVAREVVNEHGGSVIELRGDEALAAFHSARQAILAAAHAQDRFLEETVADPSFPLPVGIGLDAGEAIPLEAGYRGGALNLAARLCGRAGPGEILASQGVVHLARKVDGVRYADLGDLHLKGLAEPVRVFRAISEEGDPAERFRKLAPRPKRGQALVRLARRRPAIAIVMALALIAAVAVPTTIALRRGGSGEAIVGDVVALIDLESGELIDRVQLDSRPGAVAVGEGSVWVTLPDRGVVVEIDPEEPPHVIDTIPVGADPVGVAVSDDSIWVANAGSSTVSRISPGAENRVVDTIDVPGGAAAIAVGPDGIWVANGVSDTVSRIDPAKGEPVETIPVDDQPVALAVDEGGGLWVANARSGTVSHVSSNRKRPVQRVPVGTGPQAIAVGADAVWVANSMDGTVGRIDPATHRTDPTIPVGTDPTGLALGGGSVWVSDGSEGTVRKIDPRSKDVAIIPLGAKSSDLAVGAGGVWVDVRGSDSRHQGGTLRVVSLAWLMDSIDPANAYVVDSWNLLSLTNDGLLGFKRVPGIDGATLVPALATRIPQPTPDGKTYTFQLRADIRYSSGDLVMPADFQRAIERVFEVDSPGAGYFSGIRGAGRCTPGRGTCDLSSGIVADDEAGTVTFYLKEPDPDFPFRLTMPFAFAVPAETPTTLAPSTPLPATGPYMIEGYTPGKEIELVRNPEFRAWESRPAGFADRIIWRLGQRPAPLVDDVLPEGEEEAEADFWLGPLPSGLLEELTRNHAGQVHLDPLAITGFAFLDGAIAPFNDPWVRRALNFAVDRQEIVHEVFGPAGVVACQILPPSLPGYSPYCPYTENPDGTWSGPDLAEARRLVHRSGTAGAPVTVWGLPDFNPDSVEVGRYLVDLLNDLGYDAALEVVEGDPPPKMQIGYFAWATDYPAESGFIPQLLACDARYNFGRFCDPEIERRMVEATRLATTDPVASHELWSRIEHDLVDRAPWVPLMNRNLSMLVSTRLGNYQFHPAWGPLIDQMWVR